MSVSAEDDDYESEPDQVGGPGVGLREEGPARGTDPAAAAAGELLP